MQRPDRPLVVNHSSREDITDRLTARHARLQRFGVSGLTALTIIGGLPGDRAVTSSSIADTQSMSPEVVVTATVTVAPEAQKSPPYTVPPTGVIADAEALDRNFEGPSAETKQAALWAEGLYEKAAHIYSYKEMAETRETADRLIWSGANRYAIQHNLHLSDPAEYRARINKTVNYDEVAEETDAYCQTLGFRCNFVDNISTYIHNRPGVKAINRNEPGIMPAINNRAIMLINSLSIIPREFFAASKLTTIHLTAGKDTRGGAEQFYKTRDIEIELSAKPDSNLTGHELGHLFDSVYGGETPRDDAYLQLNPPWFRYNDDRPHPDVTRTQYGAANIYEDKATIYEQLIGGLGSSLMTNEHPVIVKKRQLLMARLNHAVPGYLNYLFDTAISRPSDSMPQAARDSWPYSP